MTFFPFTNLIHNFVQVKLLHKESRVKSHTKARRRVIKNWSHPCSGPQGQTNQLSEFLQPVVKQQHHTIWSNIMPTEPAGNWIKNMSTVSSFFFDDCRIILWCDDDGRVNAGSDGSANGNVYDTIRADAWIWRAPYWHCDGKK